MEEEKEAIETKKASVTFDTDGKVIIKGENILVNDRKTAI